MGKLGGHCNMTNMDKGSLDYIVRNLGIKTMVDVGCGPGGMVTLAKEMGVDAVGIDGDPTVISDIRHDFENGPFVIEPKDLAWSVEFLEHIEEQYLDNVFSVFGNCKYVFCTHNPKPGPWHSNCKPNEYWVKEFTKRGFKYAPLTTQGIKEHSTMVREFVQNTGMFFINENYDNRQGNGVGTSPS
jgi:SAM-dependent methyltransferase